jgi:lysozyme
MIARELVKTPSRRVKGWENLSGEPWTIGYGSTGLDHYNLDVNGKPTKIGRGLTWTEEQAEARNILDLEKFSDQVKATLKIQLNDNQFSALVSFAYNLGIGNLKSSTLLKRVNEGKFPEAAREILKWDKAVGQVMPGLVRRRAAENKLFLKPV